MSLYSFFCTILTFWLFSRRIHIPSPDEPSFFTRAKLHCCSGYRKYQRWCSVECRFKYFHLPYGNDKLTTFMNSSISNDDFLGKLKDNNRINVNLNMTLLSAGFRAWGGFNTIDVNMRSTTSLNLTARIIWVHETGNEQQQFCIRNGWFRHFIE